MRRIRKKSVWSLFPRAKNEFKQILSSKKMVWGMLGVMVLPLLYSCTYLAAFYDPYGKMGNYAVAVVNEDICVAKDGQNICVGDQLVKRLQSDHKLNWNIVTIKELTEGINNSRYHMGVVIPKNLSQKTLSLNSSKPLIGYLQYYSDPSNNYLAGNLNETIMRQLERNLQVHLSEVFVGEMFHKIGESATKLSEAADGASQLAKGSKDIFEATHQVDENLQAAQAGSIVITKGTEELSSGLEELHKGLISGQLRVDEVVLRLKTHETKIKDINHKIQKLAAVPLPSYDINRLDHLVTNSKAAILSSNKALKKLYIEMENDPLFHHHHKKSLWQRIVNENIANNNRIIASINEWYTPDLRKYLLEAGSFRKVLANQAQDFTNFYEQKMIGLSQMQGDMSSLIEGTNKLSQGAKRIEDGQKELTLGIEKLKTGVRQIALHMDKVASGQEMMAGGLADGSQQAEDLLINTDDKKKMIVTPIKTQKESLHPVDNYATGIAPYFIALSLWVGAMVLFTVMALYRVPINRDGRPLSMITAGLIGVVQAVLTCIVLTSGLHLQPILYGWLYLFTIVIALTFIAVNRMLGAFFNNFGRVLGIVLLMLQLTSSAGTYPKEMLPSFFQAINPFLPMTYAVDGLRSVLSKGDLHQVYTDVGLLLVFLVFSYFITQIYSLKFKPKLKVANSILK